MKLENPKVSIIVPIYNVEDYLERCIASLCNQTYKNIEIILVNDGSPDDSLQIAKRYANIDARISIVNQKNMGAAFARHNGIKHSTGDYLAFCDGDDELTDDAIQTLIDYSYNGFYDIVSGTYVSVFSDKVKRKNNLKETGAISDKSDFLYKMLRSEVFIALHARIFKKELFNNIKVKPLKVGQDAYLCLQLVDHATHIYCLNQAIYLYNQRQTSTTYNFTEAYLKARLLLPDAFSEILNKETYNELDNNLEVYRLKVFVSLLGNNGYSLIKKDLKEVDSLYRKHSQHLSRWQKIRYLTIRLNPPLGKFINSQMNTIKQLTLYKK